MSTTLFSRRRATKSEQAADEARRRWDAVRASVAEQAEHLAEVAGEQLDHARDVSTPQVKRLRGKADDLADAAAAQLEDARKAAAPKAKRLRGKADDLADVAGDRLDHAVDAARPQVKRLRNRAVEVADPIAERLREELSDATSVMSAQAAKLLSEVRDASRIETERVIEAIHTQAEEARAEERRSRIKALVGFMVFGMAAGAILMSQFGPKSRQEDETAALPADGVLQAIPSQDPALDGDDEHAVTPAS